MESEATTEVTEAQLASTELQGSEIPGDEIQSAELTVEETATSELAVETIEQLRDYVNRTLCGQNQLEPDIFPLSERMLYQSGSPCGILFVVHGPRSIQLNAIWESIKNTVIFYSANGQKVDKVTLEEQIDLSSYEAP